MPQSYESKSCKPSQEVQNSPHKIMGIASTANPVEIKAAYLNLARKYHPDTEQNPELKKMKEEKMKEINVAYESLIAQKNIPKKEIETASSSDSMNFDDMLDRLIKTGLNNLGAEQRTQEKAREIKKLKELRDSVAFLIN